MITTTGIAELVADALISAGIIDKQHLDAAIAVIEEEILARLALGETIEIG